MLPPAQGEGEDVSIQDRHTKQCAGQNKPRAFIVFSHNTSRQNQICLRGEGWCGALHFLSSTLTQFIINKGIDT